ncbi:MAG: hypothetical protein RL701_6744, partial [Pseudomonadota bacterium]
MSDSLEATWHSLSPAKRKAFAALLKKKGVNVFAQLPVARSDRSAALPLSYAQERMWFLAQLEPESAAYSIAGAFNVVGELQPDAVQQAVDALVRRHEPLRTAFSEIEGRAQQHIAPPEHARCEVERTTAGNAEQLAALAEAHAARPFDLTRAPLLRVTLVQRAPDRYALLFALHHIIADGWSLDLLLEEFAQLYAGFVRGTPLELPALPLQYIDYAAWQRDWLSAGEIDRQLSYWKQQLGSEHPALTFPSDLQPTAAAALSGAVYMLRIPAPLSAQAQRFAQAENVTLFMLLLAVFEALLYRWTGHADLRVGVPVTNRPRVEFEGLFGLFVNTHVHRTLMRGDETFRSLLARVRETALGAQAHADLPFEQLVEALAPERSLDHNPLFQVLYNHEAAAVQPSVASANTLRIEPLTAAKRAAQFELVLDTAWDTDTAEIAGALSYATDRFTATTVGALAARFERLLQQVVSKPDVRIAELAVFTQQEQLQLLAASEPLQASEPERFGFVHLRIAEQARLRPTAIALQGERAQDALSYAELDRLSNQWAQRLRASGVGPDVLVGLCTSRSPRMVVGALAVLKAGGAYVALDPSYPLDRLRSIVADAGVSCLLAERSQPIAAELGAGACHWLDSDDVSHESSEAPTSGLSPRNLAYVVYTSGSTGTPKGVGVEHGAWAEHIAAIGVNYGMRADDCALHFASMSFDVGVEQWACPLTHGARVFIRGDELWSAERAIQLMREHGITWLDASPAYLRELAEYALAHDTTLPLRACLVGGEALSRENLGIILRALGAAPLINAYGPTEAVITPMTWRATPSATAYAPIGRAVGAR